MRNSWLARVNTLILALLLAGGGSGLPLADALFHHLQGATESGDRIADGEAPSSHGERCSLGTPLPAMASAGSVAPFPSCAAVPFARPAPLSGDPQPSTVLPAAARPRAPPLRIG